MEAICTPIPTPAIWEYYFKDSKQLYFYNKPYDFVLCIEVADFTTKKGRFIHKYIVEKGYGLKLVRTRERNLILYHSFFNSRGYFVLNAHPQMEVIIKSKNLVTEQIFIESSNDPIIINSTLEVKYLIIMPNHKISGEISLPASSIIIDDIASICTAILKELQNQFSSMYIPA